MAFAAVFGLVALLLPLAAEENPPLLFFYAEGCSVCARAKPFLERLQADHPDLSIERYEISRDRANIGRMIEAVDRLQVPRPSLPMFILGERYWVGFTDQLASEIEQAVSKPPGGQGGRGVVAGTLTLPLVGVVDLRTLSVGASTAVIALVDGFNPCSLWVITFLLGVVVHTGSRGRVLAVGLTFLATSGALYGAFILGLFQVALLAGSVRVIRTVVVAVALGFAAINIKDYFWFGKGPSLTISDRNKSSLAERVREIMRRRSSALAMVAATAAMAAAVTLMELPCTAGLPVVWTQMMASSGITGAAFAALLALYLLIFVADEFGVLAVAALTLKQARLDEKHGRLLKLLAGAVMTSLAIALLVAPGQAGGVVGTLAAFGAAAAVTAVVHGTATLFDRLRRPAG